MIFSRDLPLITVLIELVCTENKWQGESMETASEVFMPSANSIDMRQNELLQIS